MAELEGTLTFAATDPVFDGHFPGRPVVPAVALLERVAAMLTCAHGAALRVTAVPAAKFLAPLGPGQAARLRIEDHPADGRARFEIDADGTVLAQGRVEYRLGD